MSDSSSTVREPPHGFGNVLRNIGPGIVVSGSVIGSGELINTPKQAAAFGFALLWAVALSCVIKYWLQVELARHALVHNRTTIDTLSLVPGPRLRGTGWVGVLYFLGYTLSMATLVGIFTTTAGVLRSMFPVLSFEVWAVIVFVVTTAVLWSGVYNHLEKLVAVLVAGFSLSVLVSLVLIAPSRITASDLLSGLSFSIPSEAAAFAIVSLLGALGMTANELFMYPYWILEKGYAQYVGKQSAAAGDANPMSADAAEAWLRRARGWIHVMRVDAAAATLIATLVTLAYYLVGAAVLKGRLIEGVDVVDQVSGIFTETYGPWSYWVFMLGGLCTLYSTLVVVAAATGRMWADLLCSMNFADWANPRQRTTLIRWFTIAFLTILFVSSLAFGKAAPASLVVFGQFANGIFNTPLIILGIVYAAAKTDRRVCMGKLGAVAFALSVLVIAGVLAYTAPQTLGRLVTTVSGGG